MATMKLVEKHDFQKGSVEYKELDQLCFLSKNLYNAGLYTVRQYFFAEKKFLGYNQLASQFAETNQRDFRALPAKVAQHVLKLVCQNFKSFFALLSKKKSGEYHSTIKIPKYLPKITGRQVLHYTAQGVSSKKKIGYVNLSQTNIFIKSAVENVQFIRVVPRKHKITIEIGYKKELPILKNLSQPQKFSAIDIGVDNLATVSFSDSAPFIVNGRPLKSINQFFNKVNANLVSRQRKINSNATIRTAKMLALSRKRDNKISDYLHKASRYIVNQLVSRNVTDLIIGHNNNWKQGTKLGKKNNQNFVSIPFNRFIEMLCYKCALVGIAIHIIDESYTSKASFLDRDFIPTYKSVDLVKHKFSGRRKCRGLYKSKIFQQALNADLNGSLNIMRKFFQSDLEIYPPVFSRESHFTPAIHTINVA
ncbi:MAG: transposase [Selenomonadaceae bacterium]|nr:transposase [Selenomonadaceae bacterium]